MSNVTPLPLAYAESESLRRNRARRDALVWLCAAMAAGPLLVALLTYLI